MNQRATCLNFKAKRVNIDAHVRDDIRFSIKLKLEKVDLPATDYDVVTAIYDLDGNDVSESYNFAYEKLDGVVRIRLEDATTLSMGAGRWTYSIVITLINEEDYDRTYINGTLVLTERGDVE